LTAAVEVVACTRNCCQ